jgi:hypothetical protein
MPDDFFRPNMENQERPAGWGTIAPAEDRSWSPLPRERQATGAGLTNCSVWLPPADLKGLLPEGFGLPLRVHVGRDGLRRVAPVGPVGVHVDRAWCGGLALLCRHRQLDPGRQLDYRVMWFLYQRARGMRQHLRRSFHWSRDLFVTASGREAPEEVSVIPILVAKKGDEGQAVPWVRPGVRELRDRGYEAARAAGIAKPTPHQAIHYGLASYAKDDPLSVPDHEVPQLVRKALFDYDPTGPEPDTELLENVYERASKALMKHTGDATPAFNTWFSGRNNTFVKQIAKQRRARDGELKPEAVRGALLRLGWDAYQYVAGCLSLQMQAVAKALPEPLTPAERKVFDEMYLPQPHYGNLPLLLLGKRIGFLRSVVLDLWENPGDRRAVGALHRLLQYYAVMAPDRRGADRRRKSKRAYEYDEGRDSARARGQTNFSRIAARVLVAKGKGCRCAEPEWAALVEDLHTDPITFEADCARCNAHRKLTLSRKEFAALGRPVFDSGDDDTSDG